MSPAAALALGAAGFAVCFAGDVLSMKKVSPVFKRGLFFIGCALLAASGVILLRRSVAHLLHGGLPGLSGLFAVLSLLDLALLVYTLFFALPFGDVYIEGGGGLVDSGLYALCRHPGVLWLTLFYLLAYGMAFDPLLLAAALLFGGLDTLYVLWQDRVLFPRKIPGYEKYRQTVPFLLPTAASIYRAFGRSSK